MKRALGSSVLALAALLSGCVMNDTPGVRACVSRFAIAGVPTGGMLRIVPSRIPGVEIDTATWESTAGTLDIGAYQMLGFRLSLRSAHDSLDGAIVALFELQKRNGDVVLHPDEHLHISDRGNELVSIGRDAHNSEKRFPTKSWKRVEEGLVTGFFSASDACPVAVGIVQKSELALYQLPGARLTDTRATLLARLGRSTSTADSGSLQVLSITSATTDLSHIYGVVVKNRTDTIVQNQVVALVVPPIGPRTSRTAQDTIEYLVRSIRPGAVITLVGGTGHGGRARALTYPLSRVIGRTVADDEHQHRVSWMPRMRVRLFPDSMAGIAGGPVSLMLIIQDSASNALHMFDTMPIIWRVTSDNGSRLTDTTSRHALVHAEREGSAHVTATVGGVIAHSTIVFAANPMLSQRVSNIVPQIKRYPDDTLDYRIPCTINANGHIEVREWITPEAVAQIRADTVTRSERSNRARAALIVELAKCKL